ncbi:hypothetical protein [Catenuloplanes japonicus]|uniref:hypothetical protein n=1 Tax=Catenuloplanes japonicus TaxID=33876 RepID=UPI000525EBC9|nr:hypothetical protein [Catenuloplanes japonicus]
MHAAHYLAELQRIVRSGRDVCEDSHGNLWIRHDGNLVCESDEWKACLSGSDDVITFRVTPIEW